ncbi:MAG: alpha-E domain-containing protein [Hyphomonadaceae bacterium]
MGAALMLARTADSMFWLARYMERMDSIARLIEAAQMMTGVASEAEEWQSALIAAGCNDGFSQKYETAGPTSAALFLGFDRDNPSAIINCLERARINARAMRTALTRDMWNAVNDAWLEARSLSERSFSPARLPETLDWIKTVSSRFFGAYSGNMLRNEAYWFTRLGTFIERADNTARILDVKYHVLLPDYESVGGALDYYQWTSILRAVSAVRAYQWVYRGEVAPWNVAELLILRPEMPRSLRACYGEINECLNFLADAHGGARGECHRRAGAMESQLRYGRIADIFQSGLHEYLTDVIDRTGILGNEIAAFYMR